MKKILIFLFTVMLLIPFKVAADDSGMYTISIPATLNAAQSYSLPYTIGDNYALDVSVSSRNGNKLIKGSEELNYTMSKTEWQGLEGKGSLEFTFSVSGAPSSSGDYKDQLTFSTAPDYSIAAYEELIARIEALEAASSGMQMDLLWTNPSPANSFSAQTVALDLNDYSLVLIEYRQLNTNANYFGTNVFKVGSSGEMFSSVGGYI